MDQLINLIECAMEENDTYKIGLLEKPITKMYGNDKEYVYMAFSEIIDLDYIKEKFEKIYDLNFSFTEVYQLIDSESEIALDISHPMKVRSIIISKKLFNYNKMEQILMTNDLDEIVEFLSNDLHINMKFDKEYFSKIQTKYDKISYIIFNIVNDNFNYAFDLLNSYQNNSSIMIPLENFWNESIKKYTQNNKKFIEYILKSAKEYAEKTCRKCTRII